MPAANEFFENKVGSGGTPVGARLRGSLFVPIGMGIVFEDGNGGYWQLRLAQANGQAVLDENGQATVELVPVTL